MALRAIQKLRNALEGERGMEKCYECNAYNAYKWV